MVCSDFMVVPSDVEETIDDTKSNEQNVMNLALLKAKDIAKQYPNDIVLGFDTLVILDGNPLGKPKNRQEAFHMLDSIQGKSHTVLTGCSIVFGKEVDTFFDSAVVTFNKMTNLEIEEYLDTNEPYDKAGAYGIQGFGARYIKEIQGDYYSVMGLPVQKVYNKIRKLS